MKTDFKPIILFDPSYFDLSEKLRDELELTIDKVYSRNSFDHYGNNQAPHVENETKRNFIYAYLLDNAPKDYAFSGKLLQGIKTWRNMYDDDRLSVIDKFRTCYQNVTPSENIKEPPLTIAFCKFLISELVYILAESRWQDLTQHADKYRQMLYN